MTSQILTPWSTDCTNLFVDIFNDERDATIFGDGRMILRSQSPFFANSMSQEYRQLLSNAPGDQNRTLLARTAFEYFPPTIFESIINYTYNGWVSLDKLKVNDIFELLLASGELCLQDLSERIQAYLIGQPETWIHAHFSLAWRTAFEDEAFRQLQVFCTDIFERKPELVFRSQDFGKLEKKTLLRLLNQKNSTILQVEIWERLIAWGIKNTPDLPSDVDTWSSTHYSELKRTIRDAVKLIRFWKIPANDFYNKVIPFEKALPRAIFHDILRHYLVPQPPPLYTASTPPPPYPGMDSTILNVHDVNQITDWIGWKRQSSPDSKTAFQFKLLLRGSVDGFSPQVFHNKCDHRGPTVVIIKVHGTGQIIGGYNPTNWLSEFKFFSTSYQNTTESFIFSLGTEYDKETIFSRVKNSRKAIGQYSHLGPDFGESDLSMQGFDYHEEQLCVCQQDSYEKAIMGKGKEKAYFGVEDYEVFEIVAN